MAEYTWVYDLWKHNAVLCIRLIWTDTRHILILTPQGLYALIYPTAGGSHISPTPRVLAPNTKPVHMQNIRRAYANG
jgi:hypothetical protein